MSNFRIDVTNTSGTKGTIENYSRFEYAKNKSPINEASFILEASGAIRRGLIETGSIVEIYIDGTLDFKGIVDHRTIGPAGMLNVHASGYEIWLAKENGSYSNSPWQNTASATIFSEIIGEASQSSPGDTSFSAGSIDTGVNLDFRATESDSIMNRIKALAKMTGQDVRIDYSNNQVIIEDHKGSSTSVATLNKGIEIKGNITYSEGYPVGNKILVYGKGDGENQIKNDTSTSGQDTSSQSTYGVITHSIWDKSIVSQSAANELADKEVARLKDPAKFYDFDINNPGRYSFVAGDVVTLNAQDLDLNNEEVRITQVKRGVNNGSEFLRLKVTNKAQAEALQTRNQLLGKIQRMQRESDTYMQGNSNISQFAGIENANSSNPLEIIIPIPSSLYEDEVGNTGFNSFTLDYDVDEYRKGVGGASFDGGDPQVQNASGDSGGDNTVSGNTTDAGGSSTTESASSGNASVSADSSTWTGGGSKSFTSDAAWVMCHASIDGNEGGASSEVLNVRIDDGSSQEPTSSGFAVNIGDYDTCVNIIYPANPNGKTLTFEFKLGTGSQTVFYDYSFQAIGEHSHSASTLAAADHGHSDGSYDTLASDHDNISIGDDVSDAASVNATGVQIDLDWWNGSVWINKLSDSNGFVGGETFNTDYDLSSGGSYPDAAGYWRVRVATNNATPDLVKAIVKLKHAVDN